MRNRIYWGLGVLILLIIGTTIFMVVKDQSKIRYLENQSVDVNQPKVSDVELPKAKEGYKWVLNDDHYHEVPLDAPDTRQSEPNVPVVTDEKVQSKVVVKPDWIYDPQREKPDDWDPQLVYDAGDNKIDFNFRPLTKEEQAEYERLKATENFETNGHNIEAWLRLAAIVNLQTKLRLQIDDAIASGRPILVEKLHAEYDKRYGRFPLPD